MEPLELERLRAVAAAEATRQYTAEEIYEWVAYYGVEEAMQDAIAAAIARLPRAVQDFACFNCRFLAVGGNWRGITLPAALCSGPAWQGSEALNAEIAAPPTETRARHYGPASFSPRKESPMGVKVRQKSGKWYVFLNHHGRRKAKCVGDSKRAAEEVKRKLEAKLTLGDIGLPDMTPQVILFRDYAEQWLAHYVTIACKPSSARIFRGIVRNHLVPAFGAQDLRSITRSQVKTFVVEKHQRYTSQYVKSLVRTFHAICAHAIDAEVLDRNPAAKLGKYLSEPRSTAPRAILPFTSGELAQYLTTMRAHYPQYAAYFLCLARTGMREGEALGVRWEDIQLGHDAQDPHRFVSVQRTYDPAHQTFTTPKNGRSRRVDMSHELRAVLLDLRDQRVDAAILQGATTISPLVFCGASGRPWAPSWLAAVHHRVCTLAGLRRTRIHDLRHSYATIQLYEHHAPIQYVSEQLGHASIKITVDTYGHPRQGTNIALADRLDQPGENALGYAPSAQPARVKTKESAGISRE